MKNLILLISLSVFTSAQAQLANGSIAPDFTLDDYYGNTHTLYNYLDSGMTVFVEIFAAHCPSCWNYHNTNRMKNLYNSYGPDATKELMVLALEYDPYNDSTAFTGNHQPWVTAGDWLTGTPYPIFNVEGADRKVFTDYDVRWYPLIYKVCPNRVIERVHTNQSEAVLFQKVKDCQALSIDEKDIDTWMVSVNQQNQILVLNAEAEIESITIANSLGQIVKQLIVNGDTEIKLDSLPTGIYVISMETPSGIVVEKIQLH